MRTLNLGIALALLVSGLLAGCGGGGGGGSAPAPTTGATTTFPLTSAVSAFSQTSHNYSLTGSSGGNTYGLQFNMTPGTTLQTFEGQLASTMVESLIVKQNGAVVDTETGTSYFQVSPYTAFGYISTSGVYEVSSQQQPLPASATVGQSGPLGTIKVYTDSTKTSLAATITEVWSLQADTATTAWGCENGSEVFTNGSPTIGIATCYKVDTSGNVLALRLTLAINGQSLTFQ